jgi:DNA-binding NtrC family response regulator
MSKILVVDDDKSILSAFEQMLTEQGYEVSKALHGQEALSLLASDRPDLIIMDVRMPGPSGLEILRRIKEIDRRLPVIIITGYGTMETAVQATKLGAVDYHLKPLNPQEVLDSIATALESVRLMDRRVEFDSESAAEEEQGPDPAGLPSAGASESGPGTAGPRDAVLIVGRSRAMRDVYKSIGRVAQTNATVLIRGETGTGKELVAQAIYQHSLRAADSFVVVNCVAIPETLLESEFFGHERGSFTGAEKRRIGKFEQADGGTIFLDEIGDMPSATQAKLLRVLQDKSFERVGGSERIHVDVRIIAATNRDLDTEIQQGRFREDLYHRLRVFTIHLPPLRDRREDIPRLASYFVERLSREMGTARPILTPEAIDELSVHPWPGNVRELQNCIQQAMILAHGYPIRPLHIAEALRAMTGTEKGVSTPATDTPLTHGLRTHPAGLERLIREYLKTYRGGAAYLEFLETAERLLLSEALRLHKGNQTHAAKFLGMARPTLKAKLDKYNIHTDW